MSQLLTKVSQFPTALWFSWTWALLFFKARHFGDYLFIQIPRFGTLMWGMNHLVLREKIWICEIPPGCGLPHGGGNGDIWRDCLCLSYPPWCDPFIICCEGAVQLVFRSFFRGNCSICSCLFGVFMGRGEFRCFMYHLGPCSWLYFKLVQISIYQ